MTRIRARGEDIRRFILANVEKRPSDVSKLTAEHFKISRQAVNKHLQRLTSERALSESGHTRNRIYKISSQIEWNHTYKTVSGLAEDVAWRNEIIPVLMPMPDNVMDIWHYGFTEMFNNAINHSGCSEIYVQIQKTAVYTQMAIADNGIGIFKKIQTELNLLDERHAILELHKGKLTTDPKHHTGEGIFFTSRMFDEFDILSGGVYFGHTFGDSRDWIAERDRFEQGTSVWMKINNHTARTTTKIFDQFSSGDDYGFNKTIVPVKLAQYGNEKLISRSQAKRLLARIELFKTVIFNFTDVESIGQAFADEIFRVFANQHPEIEIFTTHANSVVKRMIERAKSGGAAEASPTS
jgi:anti-sigma regulatory factor (Ser/Thr protein kinase)